MRSPRWRQRQATEQKAGKSKFLGFELTQGNPSSKSAQTNGSSNSCTSTIDGKAPVYNTILGYLKDSRQNVRHNITFAAQESWAFGLRLVREADIEHEVGNNLLQQRIHYLDKHSPTAEQ
jgi:hypothetical protein